MKNRFERKKTHGRAKRLNGNALLLGMAFLVLACPSPFSEADSRANSSLGSLSGVVQAPGIETLSGTLVVAERQIAGVSTAIIKSLKNSGLEAPEFLEDLTQDSGALKEYAQIFSVGARNTNTIFTSTTDEHGYYEIENLPEGLYTVSFEKDHTLAYSQQNVLVVDNRGVVLDVELTATGSIDGRIALDRVLDSIFGTFVYLAGTSYVAAVDINGDFVLTNVPVGAYQVVVYRAGYQTQTLDNIQVEAALTTSLGGLVRLNFLNHPPEIQSVTASPFLVGPGGSSTLQVLASDPDGDPLSYTWSAAAGTILTADASNTSFILPVAEGSVDVEVSVSDGTDSSTGRVILLVSDEPLVSVVSVAIEPAEVQVNVGLSTTLVAEVLPEFATLRAVTWSSSDETIATVDANGEVTAHQQGSAVITATTMDGGLSATSQVQVTIPVTGINITGQRPKRLYLGQKLNLQTGIIPPEADNQEIHWSTSDPSLATIDPTTGLITPLDYGTVEIIATTDDGGHTDQVSYEIIDNPVPRELALGGESGLMIAGDGTLWGWGFNTDGVLGTGDGLPVSLPTQIGTETDWDSVTMGYSSTLAIKEDGSLWGWGQNSYGELGLGHNDPQIDPLQVGTETDWQEVQLEGYTVIAKKHDGSIFVWGYNQWGQLGLGDEEHRNLPVPLISALDHGLISNSAYALRVLRHDGTIWAAGANHQNQLGVDAGPISNIWIQMGFETDWDSVQGTYYSAWAIKNDGTLWAWGNNYDAGLLGLGLDSGGVSVPTQVGTDQDWVSVNGNNKMALAIKADGTLWAWGEHADLVVADGQTLNHNEPVPMDSSTDWTNFEVDRDVILASTENGERYIWGNPEGGQLGNGVSLYGSLLHQIGSDTDWVYVESLDQVCFGIKADGTLWSWGQNENGVSGLGHNDPVFSPMQVGSDTDWMSIGSNLGRSFGLKTDGSSFAWGIAGLGASGSLVPEPTTFTDPLEGWSMISVGHDHYIGITNSDHMYVWGYESEGQLGLDLVDQAFPPILHDTVATEWSSAGTNYANSFVLDGNGNIYGAGNNRHSHLGLGPVGPQSSFTQLSPAGIFQEIAVGHSHVLALTNTGEVYSWGYGVGGRLGLGDFNSQSTPQLVPTLSDVNLIESGLGTSYIIKNDQTLWGMGYVPVDMGSLSYGSTNVPIQIAPSKTWTSVSTDPEEDLTLAIDTEGRLWSWGSMAPAGLGIGDPRRPLLLEIVP